MGSIWYHLLAANATKRTGITFRVVSFNDLMISYLYTKLDKKLFDVAVLCHL